MNLTADQLSEIHPDYIIPEEFRRCGAVEWGKGVDGLSALYEDVPVLGTSATNICYPDNRRDMAYELFDGNIAFETTFGEACVSSE